MPSSENLNYLKDLKLNDLKFQLYGSDIKNKRLNLLNSLLKLVEDRFSASEEGGQHEHFKSKS